MLFARQQILLKERTIALDAGEEWARFGHHGGQVGLPDLDVIAKSLLGFE
ncbi:hypothetical protein [Martelella soudanensis]|nr:MULTISPECIES: hypothetical protein [unclassified Martelella]